MSKKEKYPKLTEMPYYNTKVPEERTKAEIVSLLEKYGIENHQWTKYEGKETLKFIIEIVVQGVQVKKAVQFDVPQIKATKGRYNEVVEVPKAQLYRIFYYSIKSLLEATKFGIMKKEDLLFSYILTQLPNGSMVQMKEFMQEQPLLLENSTGEIE